METIGKRIERLRIAKGWSRPELGRRMAVALERKTPFSGELVRLYEIGKNAPGKDARRALAAVFDKTEAYMEFGDTGQTKHRAEETPAQYEVARTAKDELALYLFHSLIEQQQREVIKELRAFFDANQAIRKQMGGKQLRGVNDADVERAFGEAPHLRKPHAHKKKHNGKPGRDSSAAMGDYLDDTP